MYIYNGIIWHILLRRVPFSPLYLLYDLAVYSSLVDFRSDSMLKETGRVRKVLQTLECLSLALKS